MNSKRKLEGHASTIGHGRWHNELKFTIAQVRAIKVALHANSFGMQRHAIHGPYIEDSHCILPSPIYSKQS